MRTYVPIVTAGLLLLLADTADARGRYQRGHALFSRHCGACLSMGWTWAPQQFAKRPSLRAMSKQWNDAKVCTWMWKRTRKTKGPACYPPRLSARDRLDILYYQDRRARGSLMRAPLRIPTQLRPYRGPGFKSRLKARRETALKRIQNARLLRKHRRRSRFRSRKHRGQVVRPRVPRKRRGTRARRAPRKGGR